MSLPLCCPVEMAPDLTCKKRTLSTFCRSAKSCLQLSPVFSMNNAICIRTNKGEYLPGETVYGAVYLLVCRPTEANGIRVNFRGVETCKFSYDCDGPEKLQNDAVHIDFSNVNLYSQTECFQFGTYVFPFIFELPVEIPGTFHVTGEKDKSTWKVDISYKITASAVGAGAIEVSQDIVIYQASSRQLSESHLGTAEDVAFEVSRFLRGNKKVHITVKLLENFVHSGLNLQLRIIVTNETKLTVTKFQVKLLRYLKLMLRSPTNAAMGIKNMETLEDNIFIRPEEGPHVVSNCAGQSMEMMVGNGGLDRFQIPTCEKIQDKLVNIPPSVIGRHVKNQYGLEVSVSFSNGHTENVTLYVPGILPKKNKQWEEWVPPEWAFSAEIKLSASLFSAPEQLLRTEAFSGLPVFQIL